ncbi:hypothetical protein NZK35_18885 [Stieleria sp. ICT_E10.1]|uniref:hypothetical protein n=1 Tax=Stieleria sedimenti TaxID=2976331 RepID=UPI00217F42C1|nr:hypothetical protein [Stieleria sedimenti]MCS7468724.1 hypothetical protein [Stieleria sedimenti]
MSRIATNKGAIEENRAPHKKIAQPKNAIEAMTMAISRFRKATIISDNHLVDQ